MKELLDQAQQNLATAKKLWISEGKLSWAKEIQESALYIMEGGKGARPALLLWSAREEIRSNSDSVNPDPAFLDTLVLEASLALEMIHVYSLVHDDLPSMDNDDYRRGQLTLHKKYDESRAVLTGDALLTGAFEVLSQSNVATEKKVFLVRELSRASGASGMIAGQVWDIRAEREKSDDLDLWTRIHDTKTGALFGAALSMGYVIGAATISEPRLVEIRTWGISLGRLFQIVDDKLDKGPFYKALGPEGLHDLCLKEAAKLEASANTLWKNPEGLQELLEFFVHREA